MRYSALQTSRSCFSVFCIQKPCVTIRVDKIFVCIIRKSPIFPSAFD
eukprot:UN24926